MLPTTLLALGNGDVGLLGHLLLLLRSGNGGRVGLRLLPDDSAEAHDFVENHLTHLLDVFDDLEVEVEGRGAAGFVGGIVPNVQVRVLQGFLNGDTRSRIKRKHAVEEVESVRVRIGEEALEGDLGHVRQVTHVLLGTRRADTAQGFLVGCTEVVQDLVKLVNIVATLEKWTATEKFGQNTTNRPHINYSWLVLLPKFLGMRRET